MHIFASLLCNHFNHKTHCSMMLAVHDHEVVVVFVPLKLQVQVMVCDRPLFPPLVSLPPSVVKYLFIALSLQPLLLKGNLSIDLPSTLMQIWEENNPKN